MNDVRSDIGPSAIVPLWLVESGVSPEAIVTYILMWAKWRHMGNPFFPLIQLIAEQFGVSAKTARHFVDELEGVGAVKVVEYYSDDGSKINTFDLIQTKPDDLFPEFEEDE